MNTSYKRGFTLIELLVVIAIIGILSSIVLASLNSARKKGRDARRISDVKQIQLALELAYDANGQYPTSLSTSTLVTPGYISVVPTDPSDNTDLYSYQAWAVTGSAATCSGYHLGASLETSGHTALSSDADSALTAGTGVTVPSNTVGCTGGGSDFSGNDGAKCNTSADAGSYCYDVKS